MSDVLHGDCLAEAVQEVCKTVCSMEVTPEDAAGADDPLAGDRIVGLISIAGDVDWSVVLSLPQEAAVAMAEAFAGFEIPFDSEDMGDAIGELMNLVAGDTQRRRAGQGLKADISLPRVMRGGGLTAMTPKGATTRKTMMTSPAGRFLVGLIARTRS